MTWRIAASLLLAIASALAVPGPLSAQNGAGDRESGGLKYRRVYVPEADISSEVRGLIPMKREEFERRRAEMEGTDDRGRVMSCRIDSAVYRASFADGEFINGLASLQIVNDADKPAWLSLEPCSIAIHSARWMSPGASAPALGTGAKREARLLVERSDQLDAEWSLRGKAEMHGRWKFELRLPPAPRSELRLALPEGWSLSSDRGIVRRPSAAVDAGTLASDDDTNEWWIELGGVPDARITVSPPEHDRSQPVLFVSETCRYRFYPGSVDLDAGLQLDVREQPLERLALTVGGSLEIMSINQAGRRLTWEEGALDETGNRRLTLQLLEPLAIGLHNIQVVASSVHEPDKVGELPRVSIEGGIWRKGEATLVASADLHIFTEAGEGIRQTRSEMATSAGELSSLQFEYFDSKAVLRVATTQQPPELRIASGLSVSIDPTQTTVSLIADVTADAGQRFELSAVASRRWVIESIETVPADQLEDRSIRAISPDEQRVRVSLRRPITAQSATRLIVRARRQRPPEGEMLPADFLNLLRFEETREQRRLVSVASTDPGVEFKLAPDALDQRRDPATLTIAERSLFSSSPGAVLYESKSPRARSRLTIDRGKPQYAADIALSAEVKQKRLQYEVRINVRPDGSPVSTLLVHASPLPTSDVEWVIEDDADSQGIAVPATVQQEDAIDRAWQLQLRRPRSTDFTVTGRWGEPFGRDRELPLFSLPEAANQTGKIAVHAVGEPPLYFQGEGTTAIPPVEQARGIRPTRGGAFRYEPGRRCSLRVASVTPREPVTRVMARRVDLDSTFHDDGSGVHNATFEIENVDADRVDFRFPPDALVTSVSIDEREVGLSDRGSTSLVSVPLPEGKQHCVVRLRYTSKRISYRWPLKSFQAPIPEFAFPCMQRNWTIRVRPSTSLYGDSGEHDRPAVFANQDMRDGSSRALEALKTPFLSASRNALRLESAEPQVLSDANWRDYSRPLPEAHEASVTVYHPVQLQIAGLLLSLVALPLAVWPRTRRVVWLVIAAVIMSGWFVRIAGPLEAVAIGAAPGLIAAALWNLRQAIPSRNADHQLLASSGAEQRPALSTPLVILLAIGLSWMISRGASGQDDERNARPASIERVIVPTDKDGKPSGDYVYVSERLYEQLHRSASREQGQEAWILRSAQYELAATDESLSETLLNVDCNARFDVQTFAIDAKLVIPIGRGDIHLHVAGVTVDGQPIEANWLPDRSGLALTLPEIGRHDLEVRFRAAMRRLNDTYSLDLAIPRVPSSKAVMRYDAEQFSGRLTSALGVQIDEPGILSAEVGPADRLVVQLRPLSSTNGNDSQVTADQRVWWRIRPNSVLAEGRFEFAAGGGQLHRISVRTDRRLRLLPLDSTSGISRQWVEEGEQNTAHFELSPPYPSDAVLHASFLLIGESGTGPFQPPVVEAVADRIGRNWHAVSVIDGWQVSGAESTIAPETFVRQWGGEAELPRLSWDRSTMDASPTIAIQPAKSEVKARQQLDVSVTRDLLAADFAATVQPATSSLFQLCVESPPQFVVQSVQIEDDSQELPTLDWWRTASGDIVIAFEEPPQDEFRLTVEGHSSVSNGRQATDVPLLRLKSVESLDYDVRLYRNRDASIALASVQGFQQRADDIQLDAHVEGRGRLAFRLSDEGRGQPSAIKIRVSENAPRIAGEMLTTLDHASAGWQTAVYCRLRVERGVLDELKFDMPPTCTGPFSIEPAVDFNVVEPPGQSRKQLIVRPQRSVTDTLSIVVRSPLSTGSLDTVRAPDVALVDVPGIARYLSLTNEQLGKKLAWETQGLQAALLDADEFAEVPRATHEVFRVAASPFVAVATSAVSTNDVLRANLADVNVRVDGDRRYFGSVTFHLLPTDAESCVLVSPSGGRIVSVQSQGVAAATAPLGERATWVHLGRSRFPIRLTVDFIGRLPMGSADGTTAAGLLVPHLEEVPIDETLWTVDAPNMVVKAQSDTGDDPVSGARPTELEIRRVNANLESLREIAQVADSGWAFLDVDAIASRWSDPIAEAFTRLDLKSDHSRAAEVERARDEYAKLVDRLRLSTPGSEPADRMVNDPSGIAFFVTTGGPDRVRVLSGPSISDAKPHLRRWPLLGLLCFVYLVAPWKLLPSLVDWLRCNPALVVAAIGLAAWMLLPAGFVGWVIAAATCLLILLRRWPGTAIRPVAT